MSGPVIPPIKIAMIIDGEVVDLVNTDDRFAAILLSEPVAVEVTDLLKHDPSAVQIGGKYDSKTKTFTPAVVPDNLITPPAGA